MSPWAETKDLANCPGTRLGPERPENKQSESRLHTEAVLGTASLGADLAHLGLGNPSSHHRGKGTHKEGSERCLAGKVMLQSCSGSCLCLHLGRKMGPREGGTQADRCSRIRVSIVKPSSPAGAEEAAVGTPIFHLVCQFLHKYYRKPAISQMSYTSGRSQALSSVSIGAGNLRVPDRALHPEQTTVP